LPTLGNVQKGTRSAVEVRKRREGPALKGVYSKKKNEKGGARGTREKTKKTPRKSRIQKERSRKKGRKKKTGGRVCRAADFGGAVVTKQTHRGTFLPGGRGTIRHRQAKGKERFRPWRRAVPTKFGKKLENQKRDRKRY